MSNLSLTFPVGSVNGDRVTGNIQILGDMLPENAELFEFFVATVNPMDRLEGPTRATVIIQNDDISKCFCMRNCTYSIDCHRNYHQANS